MLHQIKALQDEARTRQRTWAATEAVLTERAATAEAGVRAADSARRTAEARTRVTRCAVFTR